MICLCNAPRFKANSMTRRRRRRCRDIGRPSQRGCCQSRLTDARHEQIPLGHAPEDLPRVRAAMVATKRAAAAPSSAPLPPRRPHGVRPWLGAAYTAIGAAGMLAFRLVFGVTPDQCLRRLIFFVKLKLLCFWTGGRPGRLSFPQRGQALLKPPGLKGCGHAQYQRYLLCERRQSLVERSRQYRAADVPSLGPIRPPRPVL